MYLSSKASPKKEARWRTRLETHKSLYRLLSPTYQSLTFNHAIVMAAAVQHGYAGSMDLGYDSSAAPVIPAVTPDTVRSFTKPTERFLCPFSANIKGSMGLPICRACADNSERQLVGPGPCPGSMKKPICWVHAPEPMGGPWAHRPIGLQSWPLGRGEIRIFFVNLFKHLILNNTRLENLSDTITRHCRVSLRDDISADEMKKRLDKTILTQSDDYLLSIAVSNYQTKDKFEEYRARLSFSAFLLCSI